MLEHRLLQAVAGISPRPGSALRARDIAARGSVRSRITSGLERRRFFNKPLGHGITRSLPETEGSRVTDKKGVIHCTLIYQVIFDRVL